MRWGGSRARLGADLEGTMTRSILNAGTLLGCKDCIKAAKKDSKPKPEADAQKLKDYEGLEEVAACKENTTLLLEILRYAGRDVNIVEMFDHFMKIHRSDGKWGKLAIENESAFEQNMK